MKPQTEYLVAVDIEKHRGGQPREPFKAGEGAIVANVDGADAGQCLEAGDGGQCIVVVDREGVIGCGEATEARHRGQRGVVGDVYLFAHRPQRFDAVE